MEPFFSVIVPIYNVEKYLRECLDSILSQSFQDFELICIDDRSTDNSFTILQEYISDLHLKILRNKKNQGLSYTRNRGIQEAKGKYIVFVDSDDMLLEGALGELYQKAINTQADIIYYNMDIRNEGEWAKGQDVPQRNYYTYDGIYTGQEFFCKQHQNNEKICEACRQSFRREFLEDQGILFYNGIYHEDNLFSFMCAMKAEKVVYIDKSLYLYRRRNQSIMSSMNSKRVQSYFIVFLEIWNYWRRNSVSEEVNEAIQAYLDELLLSIQRGKCWGYGESPLEFGDEADKYMYDIVLGEKNVVFQNLCLSEEQIAKLSREKGIQLYGAGNVALELIKLLHLNHLEVKAVLVSNKDINPKEICGIPIFQVDEVVPYPDDLVVIAILSEKKEAITQIRNRLASMGYKKICCYDEI